jgi:hypothetical protein
MSLFNSIFIHFRSRLLPYSNFFYYIFKGFNASSLKYPNLLFKKVIYVDPRKIVSASSLSIKPKKGSFFFLDGNWDKNAKNIEYFFENNYKFKTVKEIFVDKKLFKDTSEYKHVQQKIHVNGSYRGYQNANEYLESLYSVYDSILKDGYKASTNKLNPWIGEVEVALGRDGKLIKINSGNHRFACAYLFEIKEIPINLCAVHMEYKSIFEKSGIKGFNIKMTKILNDI